ncbi:MAG TPA: single-stranded-DNA-specific exonuclease RecJ [Ignavibacteriaceae bacterium]|nr:single-stranded-DNA-specific exonuclease RecJ [Ignavibacteriaceae bacterium]
MINKLWKIKEIQDEFIIKSLAETINISEVLARLLVLRKITNFGEAKKFFRPTLESLYDPFQMLGMKEATKRIIKAITENQNICIYGDYDVDGTCSTALLYLFLKKLGANVNFFIPKRLTEGYGISKAGIEYVKSLNTDLLISVDCGITAIDEVNYANELGINVIICDHHQSKDIVPAAVAVLDPLQPGCNYPYKYLAGAGVAFKLAQGLAKEVNQKDLPLEYLDLVALASIADIVPLIDENRILVREGLKLINEKPRPGIAALMKLSNNGQGSLSSGQIVFTLAPRINAVGRMGDAQRAVELFISDNLSEAVKLAEVLESDNRDRRKIDEETFFAADVLVKDIDLENEIPIVLHKESWHSGVIGIVASRLVEKYYRPTIMLTTVDGVAKGSARSISNFNIYNALKECEDLLIHFGGHQAAAGLAVEIDKIDEFKSKFNTVVKGALSKENLRPEIVIDAVIKFSEITPKFLRIIDQFAPFGPGNMRPVFLSENVEVTGLPRIVGNNHLIVNLKQCGSEKIFDCIGFNFGNYCKVLNKNSILDVVYSIDKLGKDDFIFPQLKIKDIKIKENN